MGRNYFQIKVFSCLAWALRRNEVPGKSCYKTKLGSRCWDCRLLVHAVGFGQKFDLFCRNSGLKCSTYLFVFLGCNYSGVLESRNIWLLQPGIIFFFPFPSSFRCFTCLLWDLWFVINWRIWYLQSSSCPECKHKNLRAPSPAPSDLENKDCKQCSDNTHLSTWLIYTWI